MEGGRTYIKKGFKQRQKEVTSQAMYVQPITEARSCNHFAVENQ
jgi:hypothetical protein